MCMRNMGARCEQYKTNFHATRAFVRIRFLGLGGQCFGMAHLRVALLSCFAFLFFHFLLKKCASFSLPFILQCWH